MDAHAEAACARAEAAFRAGRFFEAHEHYEEAWRNLAPGGERDRVQGLLHLAVALHQHQRGNRTGATRQLAKARRRLRETPDLAARIAWVDRIVEGAPMQLPAP